MVFESETVNEKDAAWYRSLAIDQKALVSQKAGSATSARISWAETISKGTADEKSEK
jgi:hypothetical protein